MGDVVQEPLRVLHAIGSLNQGGSQSFVMNLYRAMDRSLVQFDFVIEHPGELYHAEEIERLGGRVFELESLTSGNMLRYARQWRDFFRAHDEWPIVHGHVRSTASIYLSIAKKYGMHVISHSHSTSECAGIKGGIKRILEYPLRFVADDYFACSESSARWLFGNAVVDRGDAHIVPNAIDASSFRYSDVVRAEMRASLGLGDEFVVGNIGRLSEPKNHPFLLDVFEEILRLRPDAKLLLAGDGELRRSIEDSIEQRGVAASVMMLGARGDVASLYQAMDLFLMPSLYEGFPVALVEAQAAGLPAVVSNSVTDAADIVDGLIDRLSLDAPVDDWAQACVARAGSPRPDTTHDIVAAGYDAAENAANLCSYYLSVGVRRA